LSQEDINNLNKSIVSNGVEAVIKNLPTKESPGLDGSTAQLYRILKNTNALQTIVKNIKVRNTIRLIL
jgi:UDP-3-O-acyl-N-acetylglucosamine deacetylase